jgi:hypothetical protein
MVSAGNITVGRKRTGAVQPYSKRDWRCVAKNAHHYAQVAGSGRHRKPAGVCRSAIAGGVSLNRPRGNAVAAYSTIIRMGGTKHAAYPEGQEAVCELMGITLKKSILFIKSAIPLAKRDCEIWLHEERLLACWWLPLILI